MMPWIVQRTRARSMLAVRGAANLPSDSRTSRPSSAEVGLGFAGLVSLGGDAVDPPGGLVAEGVAADARIVPVGDEHRAIGRGAGIDGPKPRIAAAEEDLVIGAE
jgi:hypothetical protein